MVEVESFDFLLKGGSIQPSFLGFSGLGNYRLLQWPSLYPAKGLKHYSAMFDKDDLCF